MTDTTHNPRPGIVRGIVSHYGAQESNGLECGQDYHAARHERGAPAVVDWTEPGLRVTRLRLLSDPGFPFWDVSYCHGTLAGKPVEVNLPFDALPKRGARKAIVAAAIKAGVYARGLGILDNISTLC